MAYKQTPYASNMRKPMSQMVYKNEIMEMGVVDQYEEQDDEEVFHSFELNLDDLE